MGGNKHRNVKNMVISYVVCKRPGEGVLHHIFGSQVQHANKMHPIGFKVLDPCPKYLKTMKYGVNWIENQGENLYKMLKIY